MERKEIEALQFILNHLPETNRFGLYQVDPAVHSFVRLLAETESIKDVLHVVDDMFVHYTKTIKTYQDQNRILLERATPETMRRLQELNDAESA